MIKTTAAASASAEAAMGICVQKPMRTFGHYEPALASRVVPPCASCGAPGAYIRDDHPLAERFPEVAASDWHGCLVGPECPCCGAATPPLGPIVETPAVIVGRTLWPRLARLFLDTARALADLRKRIKR